MGVPSRVVAAAFLGLVQENLSLVTIEIVCYLLLFLLLLHIHSTGRRSATLFAASALVVVMLELVFFRGKRWHAQALVRWRYLFAKKIPNFAAVLMRKAVN